MGCNYYLRPKGFEELDRLNEYNESALKTMEESYITTIEDILNKVYKEHQIYLDILDIHQNPKDIYFHIHYPFERPDIHICKLSMGWVPLFEATKYYDSWDTFESFYILHKDEFDLVDEYDRVCMLEDFKNSVMERVQNKENQTHLVQEYQIYGIKYWKDSCGVEWTSSRNWS